MVLVQSVPGLIQRLPQPGLRRLRLPRTLPQPVDECPEIRPDLVLPRGLLPFPADLDGALAL